MNREDPKVYERGKNWKWFLASCKKEQAFILSFSSEDFSLVPTMVLEDDGQPRLRRFDR